MRHSGFNKHNLHFTAMFFLGNISTMLPPSSLPSRCIELASYACALAQLQVLPTTHRSGTSTGVILVLIVETSDIVKRSERCK